MPMDIGDGKFISVGLLDISELFVIEAAVFYGVVLVDVIIDCLTSSHGKLPLAVI